MTFEFLLRLSVFYFLFSAIPTGFLTFCLPADEATAKSVTKYSPTDSEKQTAIVCKDNGLFSLTKLSLCQKTINVSQDPAHAAVACYARNGACLVCVDDGNLNEVLSWKYGYISISVGLEIKMMLP